MTSVAEYCEKRAKGERASLASHAMQARERPARIAGLDREAGARRRIEQDVRKSRDAVPITEVGAAAC